MSCLHSHHASWLKLVEALKDVTWQEQGLSKHVSCVGFSLLPVVLLAFLKRSPSFCWSLPACRTLNVLMHGMEALTALHRISGDATVLQRLLELLDILCSRLVREQGLLYEAYLPAAAGAQWQPAPGQPVVYGEWLMASTITSCVCNRHVKQRCCKRCLAGYADEQSRSCKILLF
jgi:hypothetical protein